MKHLHQIGPDKVEIKEAFWKMRGLSVRRTGPGINDFEIGLGGNSWFKAPKWEEFDYENATNELNRMNYGEQKHDSFT